VESHSVASWAKHECMPTNLLRVDVDAEDITGALCELKLGVYASEVDRYVG